MRMDDDSDDGVVVSIIIVIFIVKILSQSIDFERRTGSGAAGDRKIIDFLLNSFKKYRLRAPGRVGSGWGSKNHRFSFKFLLKSIDFESRAGSGAAGDRKIISFLLNSF